MGASLGCRLRCHDTKHVSAAPVHCPKSPPQQQQQQRPWFDIQDAPVSPQHVPNTSGCSTTNRSNATPSPPSSSRHSATTLDCSATPVSGGAAMSHTANPLLSAEMSGCALTIPSSRTPSSPSTPNSSSASSSAASGSSPHEPPLSHHSSCTSLHSSHAGSDFATTPTQATQTSTSAARPQVSPRILLNSNRHRVTPCNSDFVGEAAFLEQKHYSQNAKGWDSSCAAPGVGICCANEQQHNNNSNSRHRKHRSSELQQQQSGVPSRQSVSLTFRIHRKTSLQQSPRNITYTKKNNRRNDVQFVEKNDSLRET